MLHSSTCSHIYSCGPGKQKNWQANGLICILTTNKEGQSFQFQCARSPSGLEWHQPRLTIITIRWHTGLYLFSLTERDSGHYQLPWHCLNSRSRLLSGGVVGFWMELGKKKGLSENNKNSVKTHGFALSIDLWPRAKLLQSKLHEACSQPHFLQSTYRFTCFYQEMA